MTHTSFTFIRPVVTQEFTLTALDVYMSAHTSSAITTSMMSADGLTITIIVANPS